MREVKILDCTLRDGAHINQGLFGKERSNRIVSGLQESKIDYVELGFIEPKSATENSTYFASVEEAENFFSLDKTLSDVEKGLMIRTDRCDLDIITRNKYIDFIRIAFYPGQIDEVIKYTSKLVERGYKIYLNLIAVTSYEIEEIKKLLIKLKLSNEFSGINIVDTYGSLNENNLLKVLPIFEDYLDDEKQLGLHLHENLNRASLLYRTFVKNSSKQKLIIDSSLGGMGRVPGNLATEVCASLINSDFNKNYLVNNLVILASQEIQSFKDINVWGYLPVYATSALLNIDRSYPEYFQKKGLSDKQNIYAQEIIAKKLIVKKFTENDANNAISILNGKKYHI